MKFIRVGEFLLRLWLGYTLVTNAGIGFITPLADLHLPSHIHQMIQAMWDTGFMMHAVKLIEFLGGIALIFNFQIPIVLLFLAPVIFNILGMHIFVFHRYFSSGLFMSLIIVLLFYRHRKKYIGLIEKN